MNTDRISWETYRFAVTGGLDTKSASASTTPDKLQVLRNGDPTKRGSVRKRRGYTAVDDISDTGELVGTARGLASRRREMVRVNDRRLYSRNKRNSYQDRGVFCSATRTVDDVAETAADQTLPCMAQVNDVTAYVWQQEPGLLKFTIEDTDGTVYTHDQTLASGTVERPSAIAIGSSLLLTYVDTSTNTLNVMVISTSDITASLASTPAVRLSDIGGQYALAEGYIAWVTDGTGAAGAGVGLGRMDSAGIVTSIVNVTTDAAESIGIAVNGDVCVAWTFAPERFYCVYDADLAPAAPTNVTDDSDVVRCSVAPHEDTFALAYESDNLDSSLHYVDLFVLGGAEATVQRAYIASAGFGLDDRGMFVLGHQSRTGLQNSYFLYDSAGNCLGSLANSIASDRPATFQPTIMSDSRIVLNTRRALDVDRFKAQFAHNTLRRYNFDTAAPVSFVEHGNSTYLSGSQLWLYDGVSAVESGFHMFPDVREGTTTASTGINDFTATNDAAGKLVDEVQYNYRFYYEWFTATGERMRSLALQRSFTPEFASGNGKIQIQIPTLAHTLKSSTAALPRGDVSIVVYRSLGNLAALFFRVSNPNPTTEGDVNGYLRNTGTQVTFVDNASDEDIIDNEQDLESLLELRHVSPPAPARLARNGTRIFIAGGDVGEGLVLASKHRGVGNTCEFSSELEIPVAPDEVTELGTIDSSLVCFTRDSIYVVSGDVDNVGGGAFESELVTTDVGCTEPGSVGLFPGGLMFKSAKGIYAVDRAANVGYIGEFVEGSNGLTVRDIRMVPDTNQLIVLCEDGDTLMYDYHYQQWGSYTNHRGISSCSTEDGQYAYLRTDGTVYVRSTDPRMALDNGSPYTMKIRTGNYAFEAGQLYWRLRRAGVLGEYVSPHKLRVGVYHNRDPFPRETAVWDPLLVIDTGLWGDETLWGDSARWGGAIGGTDYQFFRRVRNQKAQQVRFEFEDIITDQAGGSYELTEILLEVGIMPGPARVSPGRKV